MSFTDSVFSSFAKGDHGSGDGEPIATLDPILSKPVSPLLTPGMLEALAADLPPTLEQRVVALEERLARLEQQEP